MLFRSTRSPGWGVSWGTTSLFLAPAAKRGAVDHVFDQDDQDTRLEALDLQREIALLPVLVAAREPRQERLLPRLVGPSRELWGVTHVDLRGKARTEAFLGWLAGVLAARTM
jgi:hypothetical protein